MTRLAVPRLFAGLVAVLAVGLLAVGFRSPRTHLNLQATPDSAYTRSTQAVVGMEEPLPAMDVPQRPGADAVARGRDLFIANSCASCHGLDGRGSAVGPLVVSDLELVRQALVKGPGGMPAYSGEVLSDEELGALASYIAAEGDAAAPVVGVLGDRLRGFSVACGSCHQNLGHSAGVDGALQQARVACTSCHRDLDRRLRQGAVPGLVFTHEQHFEKGIPECARCHPADTHDRGIAEVSRPTMQQCFLCHTIAAPAEATGTCDSCHTAGFESERPPSHQTVNWVRTHGEPAKADRSTCQMCHEEQQCASCHVVDMPHPDGWDERPHAVSFFSDGGMAMCTQCHERGPALTERSTCDSCHHEQGPPEVVWREAHPQVVRSEGAGECFQCHEPPTCASCHVRGEETYEADAPRYRDGSQGSGESRGP